eukprot:9459868-Pyramimonas_sp.AAC.1
MVTRGRRKRVVYGSRRVSVRARTATPAPANVFTKDERKAVENVAKNVTGFEELLGINSTYGGYMTCEPCKK